MFAANKYLAVDDIGRRVDNPDIFGLLLNGIEVCQIFSGVKL